MGSQYLPAELTVVKEKNKKKEKRKEERKKERVFLGMMFAINLKVPILHT